MKIIIIDTYYPAYLKKLEPKMLYMSHEECQNYLRNSMFGTGNFYSKNLAEYGVDALEIIPNSKFLQKKYWKEQNKLFNVVKLNIPYRLNRLNILRKIGLYNHSYDDYILREISRAQPDVVYSQDLSFITPDCAQKIRGLGVKLIVGQIACPTPGLEFLKVYDLILTSFPHFVNRFKDLGIKSEYFKIAFESTILDTIPKNTKRDISCSFVGGISRHHSSTIPLLSAASEVIDLSIFGYGSENLNPNLTKLHQGEVWGTEMYQTLGRSLITLNRHIDVSENNANNMRLFEATGMGACLITDMKDNLADLFELDEEVVTYSSLDELKEKLEYLKNNTDRVEEIAQRGQQRTLNEHNYKNRMSELVEILGRYL